MFGYHQQKREKRRFKREKDYLNQEKEAWEKNSPERERMESEAQKKHVEERVAHAKAERKSGAEEGRADTEAFLNKHVEGLDHEARKALQYEAEKGIQRSHQAATRKLLGEQGQRGIMGKSGVAYAQHRDLQKLANEARGASARDLTKIDRDLALKKQAAIFAGGQGEAAQRNIDRDLAMQELDYANEKKRQRNFEDQIYKQYNRQFSRI